MREKWIGKSGASFHRIYSCDLWKDVRKQVCDNKNRIGDHHQVDVVGILSWKQRLSQVKPIALFPPRQLLCRYGGKEVPTNCVRRRR